MSVQKQDKKKIMGDFAQKKGDTGSPAVQVALLTARIENLKNHLESHKKDNHSRRGIMIMVAKRRKMLSYLKRTDAQTYAEVVEKLSIRK
ncbi:30S ribosomal protein S15 [Candidatus Gracilibacteria bacterium]|nr:30S ribosomal protein S15 [Candidatus Gracilibacteria bacterium]